MSRQFLLILVVLGILLGGCSLVPAQAQPIQLIAQLSNAGQPPLVGAPADATLTPTPFLPLAPTATLAPTGLPMGASTPASQVPPDTNALPYPINDLVPPMGIFNQPEGQTNILLMGSDQRPNDGGFRTDALLLVTLNNDLGMVNITSFPRDLYVYIPGWGMDRINTAQVRGGFQLTAQTFEYNFGVRPDHWALVNFSGFTTIIDALGGINVQVGKQLTDKRGDYGYYTVYPGSVHMDGETALWYVRARKTTSDFDRTRREQEVILAIFRRLISLNALQNAGTLYEQYKQTVSTDMRLLDVIPLLPLAAEVAANNQINRYAVGPDDVTGWQTNAGAQVLLPNQAAIREIMEQALNVP